VNAYINICTVQCIAYSTTLLNSHLVQEWSFFEMKLDTELRCLKCREKQLFESSGKNTLDKWEGHLGVGKLDVMVTRFGG
jgi:hypothetical protein